MKLLLWLALAVAAALWFSHSRKSISRTGAARGAGADTRIEAMLQCAHCGVHIPASEAVGDPAGAVFCCEEHRLRHAPR